jgi:serine/threonine protein kinase
MDVLRFRHPNIVGIMGYSSDPVSAIVYEFIPGGSLYERIHMVVTNHPLLACS